jgi:hypothetical protein
MAVEDPTKKQIEEVDPEVAKILGLEDNFDLEYDEYMTLLKERMVKGAFEGKEKLSEEDLAKIANERKRIRDLKGSKFTAPKKTVNADSFFGRKKEEGSTGQKPITDAAKLLPGSGGAMQKYKPPEEEPQQEKKDGTSDKLKEVENFLSGTLLGIVKEIRGLTEDILSVIQKQGAADKKGSEFFRKESEKGGKRDKERGLESKEGDKKGEGLIEKVSKPFKSIFDTIKNFILMTLLGSAINFLWSVFQNPMMLLKPIQGLIDGIVGFFNTVIKFIDGMVVQPVRNFIDTINSALNGFIGILNTALKMLPGSPQIGQANIPNIPEAPQIQSPDITGEKKEPPAAPAPAPASTPTAPAPAQALPKVQLNFTGGPITSETPVLKLSNAGSVSKPKENKNAFDDTASKEGGIVNSKTTAFDVSGLGPDKYLTALSLGEYILKPGAVEWLGGEKYLDGVNKMFGGSSARRTANIGDVKIEAKYAAGSVGPSSGGGATSSGASVATSSGPAHPYLSKMNDSNIKKASAAPGYCVTGSLETMQKSGVPNPAGTGNDVGNNPRGAMVQLIKSYGWKSIGGTSTSLVSPYGTVNTGIFSKSQYAKVVDEGKVPSGALIFQTRHSDWNGTSYNSRGYDMAIAQKQGRSLWNGQPMGQWIYGNTQKVVALTPGGKQGDGSPPGVLDSAAPADVASGAAPGTPSSATASADSPVTDADYQYIIRGAPAAEGMGGDPKPEPKVGGQRSSGSSASQTNQSVRFANPFPAISDFFKGPGGVVTTEGTPISSPVKEIKQIGDKIKNMTVWAKANPILATALAEKERIRGTAQTDNPLLTPEMRARMPMYSPSIQASEVAKLGKGFQGLSDNKNAFRGAASKPASAGAAPSAPVLPPPASAGAAPSAPVLPPPASAQPISKPSTPLTPPAPGGVILDQYGRDPTKLPTKEQREAAANARQQALTMGFSKGSPEYEKMVAEATMKPASIAPSSITSPSQPTIPQPPQSQPNISMLPLPNIQGSQPQATGMTKTGTTPMVYFNSYDSSEHNIVTTAALYNIWGM